MNVTWKFHRTTYYKFYLLSWQQVNDIFTKLITKPFGLAMSFHTKKISLCFDPDIPIWNVCLKKPCAEHTETHAWVVRGPWFIMEIAAYIRNDFHGRVLQGTENEQDRSIKWQQIISKTHYLRKTAIEKHATYIQNTHTHTITINIHMWKRKGL